MISKEKARELRAIIEQASVSLDDATALESIELFPKWKTNTSYSVNDRIRHDDVLYKCVQAHTSQDDWTPDLVPALFTRVSIEEYPQWVQPTGAQDAYMAGDKVTYNDKHYESIIDNNVWAPDVYGWNEVT